MANIKRFAAFWGLLLIIVSLQKTENIVNAEKTTIPGVHEASYSQKTSVRTIKTTEKYYTDKLESLGVDLRPGNEFRSDSKSTAKDSKRCKSVVYDTLLTFPSEQQKQLLSLTLYYTTDGRRGLGGNHSIILRCLNVTDEELSSVFTHEMGHLVDGNMLTGTNTSKNSSFYDFDTPVTSDDPSLVFYKISWMSDKKMKTTANVLQFVSKYAMTDPFEDFSETYTFYKLHGEEFRKLTSSNFALKTKYTFMKEYVFNGEEFGESSREVAVNLSDRPYDITVIPY